MDGDIVMINVERERSGGSSSNETDRSAQTVQSR